MTILQSKRKYPFRSYSGKEPTTQELSEELEKVYKFLDDDVTKLVKAIQTDITAIETRLTERNL